MKRASKIVHFHLELQVLIKTSYLIIILQLNYSYSTDTLINQAHNNTLMTDPLQVNTPYNNGSSHRPSEEL